MYIVEWVKKNKLASFLILFVLYLLFRNFSFRIFGGPKNYISAVPPAIGGSYESGALVKSDYGENPVRPKESVDIAPENRKVVEETTLSLQVKDVSVAIEAIKKAAQERKGFMVSANLSRPLEAARGSITIRVPSSQAEAMLSFLRNSAVKVVSENLMGFDVTDQYNDITAKLATLEKTKGIFEGMMERAVTVEEILRVQSEILNKQNQIDYYKGQALYLEKTSSSVKITAYLSTDEYSLPFAPQDGFRPNVVFKQAVRALVLTVRSLAVKAIWIGVYSVIWVPALLVFLLIKKLLKNSPLKNRERKTT